MLTRLIFFCYKDNPQSEWLPFQLSGSLIISCNFSLCWDGHGFQKEKKERKEKGRNFTTLQCSLRLTRNEKPQHGPGPSAAQWPISSQWDNFLAFIFSAPFKLLFQDAIQLFLPQPFSFFSCALFPIMLLKSSRADVNFFFPPALPHPCASAIPRFSTLISHSLIMELRMTCRERGTSGQVAWNNNNDDDDDTARI